MAGSNTGPAVFDDLDELLASAPLDLGTTPWISVDVASVEQFAVATLRPSTVGSSTETLPPYMLVSLTNLMLPELLVVPGASSGVNYGADSVRFGTPAKPGDRLRARGQIVEATEAGGGVQTKVQMQIEIEGADEPACVVESISRWMR